MRGKLPNFEASRAVRRRVDDAGDSLADALLCAADVSGFCAEGGVREQAGEPFGVVTCRLNGVEWTLGLAAALGVSARPIFNRAPTVEARQRLNFAREQIAEAMRTSARLVLAARRRGVH